VLFKTRVGICSCTENFEIRTYQPKSGDWWIFAQVCVGEAEGRSLFRKARFDWNWYFLAAFMLVGSGQGCPDHSFKAGGYAAA
jgi:hypothetical protein